MYFLTCAGVDFYSLALPAAAAVGPKLNLTALHGKMKQSQREAKLASFAANPSGRPCGPLTSHTERSWKRHNTKLLVLLVSARHLAGSETPWHEKT